MNLQKCSQGHFYDADAYASCPHCGQSGPSGSDQITAGYIPPTPKAEDESPTQPLDVKNNTPEPDMDGMTTPFFAEVPGSNGSQPDREIINPVVGWLVCIEGKSKGKAYELHAGQNHIGRSDAMQVCLRDEQSVSRDGHANVVYDAMNNLFFVVPVTSSSVYYINNNEIVLSQRALVKNDVLKIGKVKLIFCPLCDETFHWEVAGE